MAFEAKIAEKCTSLQFKLHCCRGKFHFRSTIKWISFDCNSFLDIIPLENLFLDIQKGDEKAFEVIFRLHYAGLCGYARKFVADADEAEEIVQEVFAAFWARKERIEITASLKSYLFRAVRNASLNLIKHQKVKGAYFAVNNALRQEEEQMENDTLVSLELQKRIEESIGQLPPERQKIFLMSRMEDMKYKEIAEELGISVKTVETQMGKALKTLREALGEYLPILVIWLDMLIIILKKP